jgi:hypothetical protein
MKSLVTAILVVTCLCVMVGLVYACTVTEDALAFKDAQTCNFLAELAIRHDYLGMKEFMRDCFLEGTAIGLLRGTQIELLDADFFNSKRGPILMQKLKYRGRVWMTPKAVLQCAE